VTKEDIENVLTAIRQADEEAEIDKHHYLTYRAIVLFARLQDRDRKRL